jgi:hypothetical protein
VCSLVTPLTIRVTIAMISPLVGFLSPDMLCLTSQTSPSPPPHLLLILTLSPLFSDPVVQPPVSVFPFPVGPPGTPPAMAPSAAPRAAHEPPLAPPAVPVPFVTPDAGLVPSAAPCAAPAPSAAPTTVPVPPATPRAAPPPPARYAEPVHVYRQRLVPPQPLASPAPAPEVPVDYAPPVRCLRAPFDGFASSTVTRAVSASSTGAHTASAATTAASTTPLSGGAAVYHPPVIHRDPCHTHPMVTRQAARVLRLRALSATERAAALSDPDIGS